MTEQRPAAVTDNSDASRLEIHADGENAVLTYRSTPAQRLVLIHTEVPEALGGRGLGGHLVQAAISKAGREGLTIVPLCPFARGWLERHPAEAAKVPIVRQPESSG
jgi:uncharacterized protein